MFHFEEKYTYKKGHKRHFYARFFQVIYKLIKNVVFMILEFIHIFIKLIHKYMYQNEFSIKVKFYVLFIGVNFFEVEHTLMAKYY